MGVQKQKSFFIVMPHSLMYVLVVQSCHDVWWKCLNIYINSSDSHKSDKKIRRQKNMKIGTGSLNILIRTHTNLNMGNVDHGITSRGTRGLNFRGWLTTLAIMVSLLLLWDFLIN